MPMRHSATTITETHGLDDMAIADAVPNTTTVAMAMTFARRGMPSPSR
ncbi:MAG: hypothetical protein R2735_15560 [Microthrixaceae bacterium]